MIYVGIDWAEAHHDVCVVDEAGELLLRKRIADGLEGVAQLHAALAERAASAPEVVIGIETDRGLLVQALGRRATNSTRSTRLPCPATGSAT